MPSRAHAAPAPAFEIAPGMTVGAGRWPLQSAHPADWGVPHEGVVLAMDDPAAWTDTVAFVGVPSAESVRAHLARCAAQGHAIPQVPVRYAFGIRWESPGALRSVAADRAAWWQARRAEFARRGETAPE